MGVPGRGGLEYLGEGSWVINYLINYGSIGFILSRIFPHITQLNMMNAAVVPLMRAANPSRPIYIGGLQYMNPHWILKNPDAMLFPRLPSGARDPNLLYSDPSKGFLSLVCFCRYSNPWYSQPSPMVLSTLSHSTQPLL